MYEFLQEVRSHVVWFASKVEAVFSRQTQQRVYHMSAVIQHMFKKCLICRLE